MKHITLIFAVFLFSLSVQAQENTHTLSLGAGFPNLPRYLFRTYASEKEYQSYGSGPFHFKYENRVKPWLGLGLSINHMTYRVNYTGNHFDTALGKFAPNRIEIRNSNTAFNLRCNFHFLNPEEHENKEFYLGFGMGYRAGNMVVKADYREGAPEIDLPALNRLGMEFSLGYRYFFTENLGLYSEFGLSKSIVQFGISGRF